MGVIRKMLGIIIALTLMLKNGNTSPAYRPEPDTSDDDDHEASALPSIVSDEYEEDRPQPASKNVDVDYDKNYRTTERSAMGQGGAPYGAFWNDIDGTFEEFGNAFKTFDLPRELLTTKYHPETKYSANEWESREEKAENREMNLDQRLSTFGGMLEAGISYGNSKSSQKLNGKSSFRFSGVIKKFKITVDLKANQLWNKYLDYDAILENSQATHVIVGKKTGIRFDISLIATENMTESVSQTELEANLKLAATELGSETGLAMSTKKALQRLLKGVTVDFDGSVVPDSIIVHKDTALDAIERLPRILATEQNRTGGDIIYLLIPIESLYQHIPQELYNKLKRNKGLYPVTTVEGKELETFIEKYKEITKKINNNCNKIVNVKSEFPRSITMKRFLAECQKFKVDQTQVVSLYKATLKQIRESKLEDVGLIRLLRWKAEDLGISQKYADQMDILKHPIKLADMIKNLVESGVKRVVDLEKTVRDYGFEEEVTYVLYYNSSRSIYDHLLNGIFSRHEKKLLAIKKVKKATFLLSDCAINKCPNNCQYGLISQTCISEYRYTRQVIPDLLSSFVSRGQICGKKYNCTPLFFWEICDVPEYPWCFE